LRQDAWPLMPLHKQLACKVPSSLRPPPSWSHAEKHLLLMAMKVLIETMQQAHNETYGLTDGGYNPHQ